MNTKLTLPEVVKSMDRTINLISDDAVKQEAVSLFQGYETIANISFVLDNGRELKIDIFRNDVCYILTTYSPLALIFIDRRDTSRDYLTREMVDKLWIKGRDNRDRFRELLKNEL